MGRVYITGGLSEVILLIVSEVQLPAIAHMKIAGCEAGDCVAIGVTADGHTSKQQTGDWNRRGRRNHDTRP